MLRHLGRFLFHFRWPLMAGVFVFLALGYVLQPRPMAEYRVKSERESSEIDFVISPSGQYLLHFCRLGNGSRGIRLFHLPSCDAVFESYYQSKDLCRFDADDGLAFVDNGVMYYLQPGKSVPQVMGTCKAQPRVFHIVFNRFTAQLNGPIAKDDSSFSSNILLSPDVRNWLVPRQVGEQLEFCIVEVGTGKTRAILEIKSSVRSKNELHAAFSHDGRYILFQTLREMENARHREAVVEVFNSQTGKRVLHKAMPQEVTLDRLVQFDDVKLISLEQGERHYSLQIDSKAEGYRRFQLKETIPDPVEQDFPKPGDSPWVADCEFNDQIDISHGKMVYCWENILLPKVGGLSGGIPKLPGFHYAIRDLETGRLLHTGRLPVRERKKDDWENVDWKLLNYLPGPVLLLQQPDAEQAPWQIKLEEWREHNTPWLPSPWSKGTRLMWLDATNDKTLGSLSLSQINEISTFYQPSQRSLYVAYDENGTFHILQYAYPFRKPWLLIFTWSLGIFAALATLQVLLQQIKRMLKRKPVS